MLLCMICFKRFMQVHSWSDALCIRSRISNVLVMRSSGKMLKNNFACYNILIWLKNDSINFVGRKFRELIIIDLCNNWCGTIFECFINIEIILMQFYNQIVCITFEQDRKRIKIKSYSKTFKITENYMFEFNHQSFTLHRFQILHHMMEANSRNLLTILLKSFCYCRT